MKEYQILIVTDNGPVALDLKRRLELAGYHVPAGASTAEDAVRQAVSTRPDLVLMDVDLNYEKDGLAAARGIRAHLDVPVVFLTSFPDAEVYERVKAAEPSGFLVKGFSDSQLRATVEIALDKHRLESNLRDSRQWLSATLLTVGDAVITTDFQGRIQFMNPVAEWLTGWTQEEAMGQDVTEVMVHIDELARSPVRNPLMTVVNDGDAVHLPGGTLLVARNGTEIPIHESASPVIDDHGRFIGMLVVFRDTTKPGQTDSALRQYASELQSRNEELDAYAHTVSHDLKAPLAILLGHALLLEQDIGASQLEAADESIQAMLRQADKMNNIIDELLVLAQVRHTEVSPRPMDMAEIVTEAHSRLSHMINQSGAQITWPLDWPVALGYGPWVEEIWSNYLSNAIRYGGRPPRIELGATVISSGGDMAPGADPEVVRFWVRDNGDGLSPEQQAELFAPLTRLDSVRATGHGLGLSIVRRIVEKLGGQVAVESDGLPGRGSVFSFTLPAADGANQRWIGRTSPGSRS